MKNILLALSLLCGICLSQAQTDNAARPRGNGRITGMVMDSASRQPVSFATVALVVPATDKPVSGAVCDDKGQFELAKVPAGEYQLAISFLGYRTLKTVPFTVAERGTDLNMGALLMSTQTQRLKEVEVVGQRNLIEEKVDRTVYNAENDQTTKGGDATDVLRRVPMLSVDLDGNPSLRGNQNIRVLINNKPSTIVSSSIADALKQIPADQIKSVEVITSPSAKYDAEGSAGIINIITKKNNLQGFSLGVDGSAGLRGSNLGLNGSYRQGKMGFSLGGFGRSNYNVTGDFENRQLTRGTDANGAPIQLLNTQRASTLNQGLFGRYTLGWDYDMNKYNSLAASVQYGVRNGRNYQNGLLTETFLNNSPTGRNTRNVSVTDLSGTVDMNLTYTRTFEKPQKELSILALYSRNNRTNNFMNDILSADNLNGPNRLKNINLSYNQEATLQIDYQTPIGDKQILEFGAKDIMRNVSSDFEFLIANGPGGAFVASPDARLSNALNYDQNVASGYASYTLSLPKNYTVKAGGRYEYTTIVARLQDNKDINIPSYGVLVPSLNVSKKLKKGNTVKASYNRRIQRPSLQFLNPNPQNSNPLNVTIGNPGLQPEFTNNFELGYNTYVKGTSLNFSTFARNTSNALQSVRDIIGRDTIRTTFQNIGREDAYGASVFVSINVSNKFSLNGGGDAFYAVLKNNVPDPLFNASNQGWVYSFRAFGNYTLTKGWGLQLFSFYRGRQVQLQGVQGGFGIYSLSLRKEFKNKKGSIGFGAENFLTSPIRIRNELNSPVISQTSVNSQDNINFKVNFSYRIGKMTVDGGPRRKKSIKNDDLKEGGDGGGNDGGGQGGAPGGQAPAGGRQPAQGAYPAKRPASADSTRLRKDSLPSGLDSLQFKGDSSQPKRDSTGLTPTERPSTDESPQPVGSPQPASPEKAPAGYPQKPQSATPPAGNAPKKP